ncbi:probable phospholipid hydroperoxide glutathione peroxidase isoform X2 [Henckelia pumila]|uniref:probable phospholipid hydroperoxide glutathione peroxidase isoform X2 n=1 Tax=Henckelia pumila TaxID=405737 RepID=UPI003C6DE79D
MISPSRMVKGMMLIWVFTRERCCSLLMLLHNGLEILAFPCNQFGSQEPGTNEQIQEFACTRFKAEYPIFDKIEVNGSNAAPIYKYMKSVKGGLFGDGIKWNFSKFLIDKEGRVVDRYAPTTSPSSIEKDIKKLLEKA